MILHLVLAFRVARLYASGQQTLRVKVWYKYFLVSRSFSRKSSPVSIPSGSYPFKFAGNLDRRYGKVYQGSEKAPIYSQRQA